MRAVVACCVALAAYAGEKPDAVEEQVRRVEALAAAEPPIFGIFTNLKMAEILTPKHPVRAHAVLDRTVSLLAGVHDAKSCSQFLVHAVNLMAALNVADAEQLIQRMPPRPDASRDYKAEAYDALMRRDRGHTNALVDRGLASGAFRLEHAADLLRAHLKSDPASAPALFARILTAFPPDAGEDDALFLAGLSIAILDRAPELAIEGAERALKAGWIADTDALKRLSLHDAEFQERNRKFLDRKVPKAEGLNLTSDVLFRDGPSDAAGLSIAAALDLARKQPEGGARTGALLRLSRRTDLSDRQQGMIAAEALASGEKMERTDRNRLLVFSMLARDFHKRGDHNHAVRAARLLAESFRAVCRCEDASCDSLEGREDCTDIIDLFVEYLEEERVTPEDLNIQHPSLAARIALRELARLVGFKGKSILG